MIVGNPNAAKRTATAAVALPLMIILVTAIISWRKKPAPAKEPPLHPAVVILALSEVPLPEHFSDWSVVQLSTVGPEPWPRQRAPSSVN
jgi:hypothetical protein